MGLKEGGVRGSLRNVSVGTAPAIPDSGMFQSPIYQFWAGGLDETDGTGSVPYPEVLADLPDATAVGGPIYRADQSGFEAVEYDGVDDGHDWSPDSNIPTGSDSFSWAALAYLQDTDNNNQFIGYGDFFNAGESNLLNTTGENLRHDLGGGESLSGGSTLPTGEFITVGVSYDGSTRTLYFNGSQDGSDNPPTPSVTDEMHTIGYRSNGSLYTDGFITEIILSDSAESDTAYSDYHNDRLG